MTRAVFAIPGDKERRTGGFIYEATVLRVLNEIGCATDHLRLPDSFPDPTPEDMAETLALLRAVPKETPIILDGLVFGAIDPEGLAEVDAPIMAMIHHPLGLETGLSPARAAFLKRNEAAALRHARHMIVPSPETARLLASEFGAERTRVTIALPGFERPVVQRQPLNPPLILSVGLLAPRKGHDVLMDALALIEDLPWQARIVGKDYQGEVTAALLAQRDRLGLGGRVAFTGEVGASTVEGLFNGASLFALATRYEGYGMVLSEAMFYGLPIVTCSVGAVPDTVQDAALLVPPDDPAAFADAMRRALTEPILAQQLSTRALRLAATLPTWEDTAQIFVDVIDAISRRVL
ncbi:MAG: glycosyltransferase family 4 protein [Pseudomonadota bacterium]